MKVYCAAPIRGNTDNKTFSDQIPSIILKLGHTPLTELSVETLARLSDDEIFSRDISWLQESACVIADVSYASTGVGFEISYSLYHLKIPVLALFEAGSPVSAMVTGCNSKLLTLKKYSVISDIQKHISSFLKSFQA